ncbi:MAG: type II CAAX endopeptidase family protein [Alistipes sp.]
MKRSIIILTAFVLFFYLWHDSMLVRHIGGFIHYSLTAHYTLNYLLSGIVLFLAALLLHKLRDLPTAFGLSGNIPRAALFALLCTAPMFIGYMIVGQFATDHSIDHFVCRILIAALFEELVFRGFVFGQLFRNAGWGFLPATLLPAVVFGALHLCQGHDAATATAAFGVTAAGSIFFSWIYVEWNYNLWYAICLHTLMNAPWILFVVGDSGTAGNVVANILRICTILIAIGLTIRHKRRNALPYCITRNNLLINKNIQ